MKSKPVVLRTLRLLTKTERAQLIVATLTRLVLVGLDLIGVALVGISISIASGTATSPSSLTGKLLSYIQHFGFSHGYAVIAFASIVFFLFKAFLSILLNNWLAKFTAKIESSKSNKVFEGMLGGDLDDLTPWTFEELNTGLIGSFQMAFGMTLSTISAVIGEIALIISVGAFLAYTNIFAFITMLVYFGLLGVAMNAILNRRSGKIGTVYMKSQVKAATTVNDSLRNFRQIATSGQASSFVKSFSKYRTSMAYSNASQMTISMMPRYIMEVALMLGIGALVAQLSIRNMANLTPAAIAVFVAGAFRIVSSMLPLQGYLALLKHANENSRIAVELTEKYGSRKSPVSTHLLATPAKYLGPEVEFQDVTYTYPGRTTNAAKSITLRIQSGDFIAIQGRSGSGKSTFADLLIGLRSPQVGRVTIDGLPAREYVHQNPGSVAYVSQSTPLFSGTLLENITMSDSFGAVDEDRLKSALKNAHIDELVEELPEGLDTLLSGGLSQLSGGQVQRVGLARALYLNSSLIVLDEATSALDNETEEAIANALSYIREGKTVIVIAHRKATIAKANRVFRFNQGKIQEI